MSTTTPIDGSSKGYLRLHRKLLEHALFKDKPAAWLKIWIYILVVVEDAGRRLGSDKETCIQILDEGGSLQTSGVAMIDLHDIPSGLSAEETKRFLREHGVTLCGPHGAQRRGTEERNDWKPRPCTQA